ATAEKRGWARAIRPQGARLAVPVLAAEALAPGTAVRHRARPGVQRLARCGRGPPWAVARADGIVRPPAGRARAALFRGPDRGRHRSRPRLLAGRREDACCAWSRSAAPVDLAGGLDAMNDLEDLLREEL